MAYRIEIELIEESKMHHAMFIFNALTKLTSKFGLANFRYVRLMDDSSSWVPLVNINCEPRVGERLKDEMNTEKNERKDALRDALFNSVTTGDTPN